MSFVIVFANQKGGVAKTTSTANLGAALAAAGSRVLLVDLDPQANLSEAFGVQVEDVGVRIEDLIAVSDVDGLPAPFSLACGVNLIPASDELATVAVEVVSQQDAELRLRRIIALYRDRYDFVLVDTPPGLGTLSSMALIAGDYVIVPARPADHDLNAAGKIFDLIEGGAFSDLNPDLQVLGVLLTQTDPRWRIRRESHQGLKTAEMPRLPIEIPFAVRVSSAPRNGAPTFILEPHSRVTSAYQQLATFIKTTLRKEKIST